MFLACTEVLRIIEDAIRHRKILKVTYQHAGDDQDIVTRTKAPFDIGSTNPKTYERNNNNLYTFCFNHKDSKTGLSKPMVHPSVSYVSCLYPTRESSSIRLNSLRSISGILASIIGHGGGRLFRIGIGTNGDRCVTPLLKMALLYPLTRLEKGS